METSINIVTQPVNEIFFYSSYNSTATTGNHTFNGRTLYASLSKPITVTAIAAPGQAAVPCYLHGTYRGNSALDDHRVSDVTGQQPRPEAGSLPQIIITHRTGARLSKNRHNKTVTRDTVTMQHFPYFDSFLFAEREFWFKPHEYGLKCVLIYVYGLLQGNFFILLTVWQLPELSKLNCHSFTSYSASKPMNFTVDHCHPLTIET